MEIRIENLSKVYEGGVQALRSIHLRFGSGVLGLLGPNGAGKTTLMRILATLLEPTEGTAWVNGYDVRKDKEAIRSQLGYLPQSYNLYPSITVEEFLDYMAILYRVTARSRRRELVERALERTSLLPLRRRRVGTLSNGMRQRLGIAQALLVDPQLIIVDEPTAGLDPEERIRMRSLLAELGGERTILLSTHIVADVEAVADSLAVLHEGILRYYGPPRELLRRLEGKVWEMEVGREDIHDLKERCCLTGLYRTPAGMHLRAVSEEAPHDRARPAVPALEDAYIWLMGGRGVA